MKTDPARAEQDERILRLRCAGLSLRAIGVRVGLSHQGVADRITQALAELVTPAAEEYRQLEAARLLDLTSRAYAVLDAAETGELALKAVDRLTKLSESRRKLWGLDATEPLQITLGHRLDMEGELIATSLRAAFDALGLSPDQEAWAAYAASAAMYRASGQEPPDPPPSPPAAAPEPVASAPAVEEPEPDLMADYRAFCEAEGVDPDGDLDDLEDDDGE